MKALVFVPEAITALLVGNSSSQPAEIFAPKGPVFSTAIISGVMGAKKTSELIPFCHPVALESCDIKITVDEARQHCFRVDCTVSTTNKTGVEMEALVGASSAALCMYDMLKALSHDIIVSDVMLVSKSGGKRDFKRTS